MNQKTVKELKKIINFDKSIPSQRRLLSKLKVQYSNLSWGAKPIFLEKLRDIYNNN